MPYLAKSDNVNTISQFVRRKAITVTTEGTSIQADYQVKLTIAYESEMQATFNDIRFNTKDGSYVDYWIETYTASTTAIIWVKLPDAITDPGSDIILMYYGNPGLSNGADGNNTFLSFFDGDSAGWTEVDPNSHIAFTNNRLDFVGLSRDEDAYVYQSNANVNGDILLDYTTYISSIEGLGYVGFSMIGDIIDIWSNMDNGIQTSRMYSALNIMNMKRVADVQTVGDNPVEFSLNTQYWLRAIINRSGNMVTKVYSDSDRTSQVGSSITVGVSDVAATLDYIYLLTTLRNGVGNYITGWIDDFKVRKYIANEPTPSYGIAQHQRRIPQFIG